jgi:DNA-binding MarR family transcriptional regulator
MESNSLTFLFNVFSSIFRDGFEKQMVEIGLHSGQVFVLFSLWEKDGLSQSELVKKLGVSPPTIFNMLKRLAENGFVTVRKDEDDARITRVYLESKGREIRTAVEQQWQDFEENTFAVLTEAEKIMFSLLLEKLAAKPDTKSN